MATDHSTNGHSPISPKAITDPSEPDWRKYSHTPNELTNTPGWPYMGSTGFNGDTPEETLRNIAGVLRVLQEARLGDDGGGHRGANDGVYLILDLAASAAANQAIHMRQVLGIEEEAQS